MSKIRAWALLTSSVLLVACAEKPVQDLSDAQFVLEAAKSAEAQVYASSEFSRAEEALKEARAEITAQDEAFFLTRTYERAKTSLAEAKKEAEVAKSAAITNKEKARQEAEAALSEAQESLDAAGVALAEAPRGKGSKADREALQADLEAAFSALEDARAKLLETGKYFDAIASFRAIHEKAQLVNEEVRQAMAKKRRG